MKIALADKKTINAFLEKKRQKGRILISSGLELRATWGDKPLVAKWDKKDKLVIIPSEDRGVKKIQSFIEKE